MRIAAASFRGLPLLSGRFSFTPPDPSATKPSSPLREPPHGQRPSPLPGLPYGPTNFPRSSPRVSVGPVSAGGMISLRRMTGDALPATPPAHHAARLPRSTEGPAVSGSHPVILPPFLRRLRRRSASPHGCFRFCLFPPRPRRTAVDRNDAKGLKSRNFPP